MTGGRGEGKVNGNIAISTRFYTPSPLKKNYIKSSVDNITCIHVLLTNGSDLARLQYSEPNNNDFIERRRSKLTGYILITGAQCTYVTFYYHYYFTYKTCIIICIYCFFFFCYTYTFKYI